MHRCVAVLISNEPSARFHVHVTLACAASNAVLRTGRPVLVLGPQDRGRFTRGGCRLGRWPLRRTVAARLQSLPAELMGRRACREVPQLPPSSKQRYRKACRSVAMQAARHNGPGLGSTWIMQGRVTCNVSFSDRYRRDPTEAPYHRLTTLSHALAWKRTPTWTGPCTFNRPIHAQSSQSVRRLSLTQNAYAASWYQDGTTQAS